MAGRKPGAPKTGGRQKGSVNKVGADVRALAREYTVESIETLAKALTKAPEWSARVNAAKILLERGWGAPKQVVEAQHALYVIGDRPLSPEEWAAKYADAPQDDDGPSSDAGAGNTGRPRARAGVGASRRPAKRTR